MDLGVRNLIRRGCEGFSTGKKRRSIYARGQDEQEDEEIISEEGS